jgi:transposase
MHPGAIHSEEVVAFLKVLQQHIPQKLLIIWDGAAIHRSRLVKEYAAGCKGRLQIERLPAYAPELNPAEYLWAHLKEHEIANLVTREGWQLTHHATAALRRMRRRPRIIHACWAQAELWP